MPEIEVRANVSCSNQLGEFRRGQVYQLDADDRTVQVLLGVGYFTELKAVETDGTGQLEQGGEAAESPGTDDTAGGEDD